MFRKITQILVFWINIVGILSYAKSYTIEQTNGYKDTWVNMNRTCSLLGVGLNGSMQKHQVAIPNAYYITETGWISAHVKREGTLKFLGCTHGTVRNGAPGIKVSYRRIPACIYFCGSREVFFTRNICYCNNQGILVSSSACLASQCGNEENPLFCGQSSNCMCRYRQLINTNTVTLKYIPLNIKNCSLAKDSGRDFWRCKEQNVIFQWNDLVKRDVFYWGNNPSLSNVNQSDCVAIVVSRTNIPYIPYRLLPLALPCSTNLPGICIQGTRISKKLPMTQPSTSNIHPTNGYDTTSDLTSHKTSKQTPSNLVTQYHLTKTENTMSVDISSSGKTSLETRNTNENYQSNIIGPVIVGAGVFVVILIVSVGVIVCVVRKRRHNKNCRSELPRELHGISSGKQQHQNQNFYSEVDSHVHERTNRTEYNGEYDLFTSKKKHNGGHDMYDHTSGTEDNTYGHLNRNGKPYEPSDTADIYDHTRAGVNGDTYDTFQTGACREDSSNNYYDHTFGGETYEHLGEGAGCMEGADDTYDHSGAIIRSNGDMYDSFQTDRDGQETDVDRYEYSSVNTGDNCYDSIN